MTTEGGTAFLAEVLADLIHRARVGRVILSPVDVELLASIHRALLRSEPVEHPSVGFYRRLLAFYEPDDACRWLLSRHSAFGVSPLLAIREGRAAEVDAEIQRLETGAYV